MEPTSPLNGHELLGVVSSRLIHSLTNYLAALSGNLAVVDAANATPEDRAAALSAIRKSARSSAELLDRFSDLSRSVRGQIAPCPLPEFLAQARQWISQRPGWEINIASLDALSPLALPGPWKWIHFIIDAVARHYEDIPGSLRIEPAMTPRNPRPLPQGSPVAYINLTLLTRGPQSIRWQEHRESFQDWNLTAAFELINLLGSQPETKPIPKDLQQTLIVLPLVEG